MPAQCLLLILTMETIEGGRLTRDEQSCKLPSKKEKRLLLHAYYHSDSDNAGCTLSFRSGCARIANEGRFYQDGDAGRQPLTTLLRLLIILPNHYRQPDNHLLISKLPTDPPAKGTTMLPEGLATLLCNFACQMC
jgi:hypothetical protein